jgi:hypothetical protein
MQTIMEDTMGQVAQEDLKKHNMNITETLTTNPMTPDIEKPKTFSTRKEADAHYDTLKHAIMLYSKKYGYMVCWLSCKPLDYTIIKSK